MSCLAVSGGAAVGALVDDVDLIVRRLDGLRLLLVTSHVVGSRVLTIIGIAAARLVPEGGQS